MATQITPAADKRARAWAFTVNNYTPVCISQVVAMVQSSRYGIAGFEVCPTTATPHIQGFVYFNDGKTLSTMKTFLPRAHLEIKYYKATADHNEAYCAKAGQLLIRHGTPPKQGERTDVEETYRILRSGGRMREITDSQLGTQCLRIAETWLKYHEPKRNAPMEIYWIHGPKGAGKTHAAYQILDPEDTYTCPRTTSKFWDGYDAHSCVLIDDIRRDWCKFVELLGITDRYAYQVEVKGSSRQLRATKMVITCPYTPEELYRDIGEDLGQLTGRLTDIISLEAAPCRRSEPRRCTLAEFLSTRQVNHACGSQEGDHQGPVQEETQAGDSPGDRSKNLNRENNLNLPVIHDDDLRPSDEADHSSQTDSGYRLQPRNVSGRQGETSLSAWQGSLPLCQSGLQVGDDQEAQQEGCCSSSQGSVYQHFARRANDKGLEEYPDWPQYDGLQEDDDVDSC